MATIRSFFRFLDRRGWPRRRRFTPCGRPGWRFAAAAAGRARRARCRRRGRRSVGRALDRQARRRAAEPALRLRPAHRRGSRPWTAVGGTGGRDPARHRQRRQAAGGTGVAGGAGGTGRSTWPLPARSRRRGPLFLGARGGRLDPAVAQKQVRRLARACWACRKRRRPTRCAIPLPPTCWPAAAICAPSRSCWATPRCRRRSATPRSTPPGSSPFIEPRILALGVPAPGEFTGVLTTNRCFPAALLRQDHRAQRLGCGAVVPAGVESIR